MTCPNEKAKRAEGSSFLQCPTDFGNSRAPDCLLIATPPRVPFLETQVSSKVRARGEDIISRALIGSEVLNQWRFHARPERVPSVPFSDRPSVFAWTKKPMSR